MKGHTMNALEEINKSIQTIESYLATPVLDGTPFLLIIDHPKTGRPMVYGEWDGIKGFKDADSVPDHLCGSFQMSDASVQNNIARLVEAGEKNPRSMHHRAFRKERLQNLINLREAVAAMPTDARRAELQAAFKKVETPGDWKAPIWALIDPKDKEIVAEAIRFFTATEATFTPGREGMLWVKADGYRRGPAGDH